MPAYSDPANNLCTNGEPQIPTTFCPLPVTQTTDKTYPISLNISGTAYSGTLTVDWLDRYSRIISLLAGLYGIGYSLQKALNFKVEYIFRFKNPFKVNNREEFFGVSQKGPEGLFTMLVQIDKKLDMMHLDMYEIQTTAAIIEHWQLRPESTRPLVALLWGEFTPGSDKIGSAKYQTSIPHCDPSILVEADNDWGYEKGEIQLLVTLKDNSKIIMYVKSKAEGQRIYAMIREFLNPAQLDGAYIKWGEYSGPPFKPGFLRLRRADWFPEGPARSFAAEQAVYSAVPRELQQF